MPVRVSGLFRFPTRDRYFDNKSKWPLLKYLLPHRLLIGNKEETKVGTSTFA